MRLILLLLFALSLCSQDAPKQSGRPPEPKNLKVLKIPPAKLIPLMRSFTAALGVECVHCHVQGNFASDDNPKKEIGRHMIEMAQGINSKFPDGKFPVGKTYVTCYTCHRGDITPKMVPEPKPPAD